MATVTVSPDSRLLPGTELIVRLVLAVWLVLVILLGVAGEFVSPPGRPPLPIAIGAVAPIVIFFTALAWSRSFRAFVLGLDLRLITGIQAWRFAGLGFLALYAYEVLPGAFALPAGLGDMAIGFTAPWIALALTRRPGFAAGATFRIWNALGLLDLVTAIGTGTVSSMFATGAVGEITTTPMTQLPLVLVPGYLVPIFVMLHVASLLQSRSAAEQMR
jgi:hypothetical protein